LIKLLLPLAVYEKRILTQARLCKNNLFNNFKYSLEFNFYNKIKWFHDFHYDYFMWLFEFVVSGWTRWWDPNQVISYNLFNNFEYSLNNSKKKTEKFTGPNKVLLVLGRRTGAHCEDCFFMFNDLRWEMIVHFLTSLGLRK
jgi:hypothetical protein